MLIEMSMIKNGKRQAGRDSSACQILNSLVYLLSENECVDIIKKII